MRTPIPGSQTLPGDVNYDPNWYQNYLRGIGQTTDDTGTFPVAPPPAATTATPPAPPALPPAATTAAPDYTKQLMTMMGSMLNFDKNAYPQSQSTGYTGLPKEYATALLGALFPQLLSSMEGMKSTAFADDYYQNAMKGYRRDMQNTLRDVIPQEVGRLANRGILSSSVAGQSLGDVQTQAYREMAEKGYRAAMEAAFMKGNLQTQIPHVLTGIAGLGRIGTDEAWSKDPGAQERALMDLIARMM